MSYEITVTRKDIKTVTKRGEYTVIGERPWTGADFDAACRYQNHQEFLKDNPVQKIYGYAPSWEGTEETKTEVLRQNVEELDIAAVIKAINNL